MQWRLRLSKFGFVDVQHAGIKHHAPDAQLRLNLSCNNESPLEYGLPLYVIYNHNSPPFLVYTVAHKEDRAQSVPNTTPLDKKLILTHRLLPEKYRPSSKLLWVVLQ